MPKEEAPTFMIEDAQIIFRNFEGREGPMNNKGNRNFAAILDEETAKIMSKDGWNVKYTNPQEEGDEPVPFIPIAVSFKYYPPRVTLIAHNVRTPLFEDTVEILDGVDITKVDLICRGYSWEVNGKTGLKAYVKTMFVTINEDELERKYALNEDA